MATITGNSVYADPTQWWTLDYTFANSKFVWSVTCHASHTSYWNSIYGLTVNVGGNSYYRGDIDWRNYTPNTVVYNGETNLSDCTVSGGVVTLTVSGNFYYGTWNTDYRSYGSGTCAVDPPTVATLTYTATNKYSSMVVAGRSVITFTMKGTSQTGSNTINYSLYQDGSVISTSTGTSGSNKTVNVTAPSAGSHTYKYTATDGNGTSTTSGNVSITTYAYTPPAFSSVSAVRWSTGNSSGTASDTGTYAKCIGNFTQGKVGTTALTTTLTVTVNNTSSTTTTSGTALYMGGGNLSADNSYTVTFGLKDTYVTTTSVTRTDTLTQGGRGIDMVYGSGHYGVAIGQKATANQFDINMTTNVNTGALNVNNVDANVYNGLLNIRKNDNTVTIGSQNTSFMHFINSANIPFYFNRGLSINGNAVPYANLNFSSGDATHLWTTVYANTYQLGTSTPQAYMNYTLATSSGAVSRSSGLSISSQKLSLFGKVAQITITFNAGSTAYSAGSDIFKGSISNYKPTSDVMGVGYYTSGSYVGWLKTDGSITVRAVSYCGFSGGTATISWTYLW